MSDAEIIVEETEAVIEIAETDAVIEVEQQDVVIEDTRSGPQGATGPQGPVGPAGSDTTYVHTQTAPSDTWVIPHGLDKFPAVDVVDSGSNVVVGEIHYNNSNTVTITFIAPFSGKAFLN